MKQFLRHISLLLALFMATASAWAECYILNSPTEIKIEWKNADTNKNGNYSSEYSFDGPCAQLTFKYRLDAITDASNWHKITVMGLNNDNQWIELGNTGEIFNAGTKTAMFDLSSYANKISAIKFKRTANSGGFLGANNGKKDVLIREITIKRYTSIAASSIDPFPETKLESETASQNVTVTYSNIGNNYSIIQENTTDFSIEKLPFDYSSCGGEMYFKITFHPKGNVAGVRTGSVTIAGNGDGKSNDNTSVKINLTGKATGEPEHRWDGKTAFLVDETVDLSTWYSSNKDGARTYEIVSFDADDETGVTPTLTGTTIKLTRAGKLTVRMKQNAYDIYTYKESTQTFKISKYDSNFKWNNPDNLQCYVDDYCNEAALFSRASDLPLTITSSNPNVVRYQDGTFTADGAGTAVITVKQDKHYKWTEFEETYTIHVNKYDVSATIAQESAVWNELINNAFSVSYGLQDYNVTSSNTNIAQYLNGNKIQTYFTSGTVQFRIFREEDRKYKELNQKLELQVSKSSASCMAIDNEQTSKDISGNQNATSEIFSLKGIGDILTFKYCLNSSIGDATWMHYITPTYSVDGVNFSPIKDANGNDYREETQSMNNKKSAEIPVPNEAKYIQFVRTANGIGSRTVKITEIYVTRKNVLTPQIDGDIFYLTQVASGLQFAGTFPLEWSTCCDNIRFSCDNPNFVIKALDSNNQLQDYIDASNAQGITNLIVTYSADTNNPDLTGTLTIYDQSQSKTITLSCEQLLQTIDWPQYFYNIEADENGNIYEEFSLNAVARTVNGQLTNRPIHYTLAVEPADKAHLSTDANGKTHLIITGVCEGFITASVDEFTDEKGKRYSASQLTRDIRVRREGEPCNTLALRVFNQHSTHGWGTNYIVFPIGDLPEKKMTFGAHAEVGSLNNWLDIDFHMDANAAPNASGWTEKQRIWINAAAEYTWGYEIKVPENAKQVRFEAGSSMTTYINMVRIYQQEYLRANVERIELSNAIVNQQFSTTFEVKYSAVPFIQYHVTNNNNLNLQLIPSPEITNNCSDYGTYTFTLKGMSPYPQTNVEELITIFTTAGHKVEIPVVITSSLSDTYYFNQQAGNWGDLNNWRVNKETTPTELPTASNPVVITKPMTINEGELVAYGVTIENGGSVNIQPKGGLTLHAGGFTEGVTKDNFTILNNQDGVGYVRVSPYFTRAAGGTMPNITVLYTTRAMAGGAKDQVWQYVGAPGNNMQMSNDGVMVYLWSEKEGWLYSNTNMTPFAGYALTRTAEGSGIYNISAQPINGNHTIDLTYTQGAMEGGNLFVNSYLAPIDVTKFTDDTNDFEGDIEKTFYLFNSGSWEQWQGQGGSTNTMVNGSSAGQYYAIAPFSAAFTASEEQKVIPPMQGVYVVVGENGGKIKLQYNKHIFRANTKDMNRPMRAPQEENEDFMRVRMQVNSQNSGADRMYLIQHENTTRGYDNGYDAKNILAEGQANIYTNEVDGQMEISVADQIDSTFIGFTAGEDSVYTLTFTSLVGEDMYLHDLVEDSLFLLVEDGQYTFSAQANSVNDMRFQLILHPELPGQDEPEDNMTTGMDNVMSSARVWVNDKRIYIAAAPQNSTIAVYTVSGMCITSPLTIHETPCTVDLSHLPTGVYVLRLNNQAYKFVCK